MGLRHGNMDDPMRSNRAWQTATTKRVSAMSSSVKTKIQVKMRWTATNTGQEAEALVA